MTVAPNSKKPSPGDLQKFVKPAIEGIQEVLITFENSRVVSSSQGGVIIQFHAVLWQKRGCVA